MKITVIVRTHNEERNLERFVDSYPWADKILIQDDKSANKDYLIDIFTKNELRVGLRFYNGRRLERNGVSRAIHHVQLNSMIDWAEEIGTDWIIYDDCDCFPTKNLTKDGRKLIEISHRDFIYATRYYLYKDMGYAPKMSPDGSLWAWRANKGFRFLPLDDKPQTVDEPDSVWNFHGTTFALLHNPWPDDETIARKMDFYSKLYDRPSSHPRDHIGEVIPLERWMID